MKTDIQIVHNAARKLGVVVNCGGKGGKPGPCPVGGSGGKKPPKVGDRVVLKKKIGKEGLASWDSGNVVKMGKSGSVTAVTKDKVTVEYETHRSKGGLSSRYISHTHSLSDFHNLHDAG
jgi:hypothetical protein